MDRPIVYCIIVPRRDEAVGESGFFKPGDEDHGNWPINARSAARWAIPAYLPRPLPRLGNRIGYLFRRIWYIVRRGAIPKY